MLAKRPAQPKRTLLIDGDVLCYKLALTAEQTINWADQGAPEMFSVFADAEETKRRFKSAIYALKDRYKADWAVIAVTYDTKNFRKEIYPAYKENRGGSRPPMLLAEMRKFCVEHFGAIFHERLEADDILGILATGGNFADERGGALGETIIVSDDKDLRGIPGRLATFEGLASVPISVEAANNWHAVQTLMGDRVDNYPGCAGLGKARAEKIVQERISVVPYEHVFKSGPRKGLTEKRWEDVPNAVPLWDVIVTQYAKAGLTEEDALVQARCAWILRAENWNNDTQEITLWTPGT